MKKAKRPCNYIGCRELSEERFCEKHKGETWAAHQRKRVQKHGKSPYHTKEWREVRVAVARAAKYVCQACNKRQGNQCDHIVNHEDYDGSFFDRNNLQWLCYDCHKEKTKQDNSQRQKH